MQVDLRPLDSGPRWRELFIDNPLVRIHFIIEMIWWIGLAPWEFEFPFPGSLIPTFLERLSIHSTFRFTYHNPRRIHPEP
jgi:hypothetical protein